MRILCEGKTKIISESLDYLDMVVVSSKNDLTKNDDPNATCLMDSKGAIATETASIVFEILRQHELPVAYQRQLDETTFLASRCQMIPLEIIVRWSPAGSLLKRYPGIEEEIGPYFPAPYVEFFLKTSQGRIIDYFGDFIQNLPNNSETGRPFDDPFIYGPGQKRWTLKHPKMPILAKGSTLVEKFNPAYILPKGVTIGAIIKIANQLGYVLRDVFNSIGLNLIDFKFEVGIDSRGELLIADVIDNDSWRLKTYDGHELSKELFRQNADMETIQEAYQFVVWKLRSIRPKK